VRALRVAAGTEALEICSRKNAVKRAVPLSRYFVYFALAIGVCAADLTSKSWIFHQYPLWQRPAWLWDGVLAIQPNLNGGALFGMGQGLWTLFAALSLGAAIAIFLWLFVAGAACDRLLTIALGLVTGGILGNLYDRLGLHGLPWPDGQPAHAVRDFILVMIGSWPWPTFNLADSALVCGAILLVWHAFFVKTEWEDGAVASESDKMSNISK
jgi:signal peptidase II